MVLWIKKNKVYLILSLGFSLLFLFPYLLQDFVNIEHDTFFHLSRIEGYAGALSNGKTFPTIYPYKNNNFGYASGLFYCDLFLILPSLLYLLNVPLSICYVCGLFLYTYFACLTMFCLLKRFTKDLFVQIVVCFGYMFANYHITNVYVRGSLGEVIAMIFIPIIITGLYDIYEDHKLNHLYVFGLTGLALSHNISFLFGVMIVVIYSFCFLKKIQKDQILYVFKETGWAFLFTLFFILPIIEQTQYQTLFVNHEMSANILSSYTIPLWKYFANTTIFGFGEKTLEASQSMLVNPGYFLSFLPLGYFLIPKKNKNLFTDVSFLLGYFFYLIGSDFIPWQYLNAFAIIQFPWRNIGISMILMPISCVVVLDGIKMKQKDLLLTILLIVLGLEAFYHVSPVLSRTFGITSKTSYTDITEGRLTDPYYGNSFFKRVELASANYLPVNSPDFRTYSTQIKDSNKNDLNVPYEKNYQTLTFSLDERYINQEIILPITSYKGYQVYYQNDKLPTYTSDNGMVAFVAKEKGNYHCTYVGTTFQHITRIISFTSFVLFIVLMIKNTLVSSTK
ncbi:MAG: hypothetical protein IKE51_00780 [Solobacterium sp.]|nr:hypothetical protein [Solobacterium sp.]